MTLKIIINNSSMQPIYEQIVDQIKSEILQGKIKQEEMLPSVRNLAKDLRISALTAKKAYDTLEMEGFIVTVHGKGSFVSCMNQNLQQEEKRKEIENEMEQVVRHAKSAGLSVQEIQELFQLIIEG